LEREIAKVVRSKAVQYSFARDGDTGKYIPEVSLDELEKILGGAKYEQEVKETAEKPGIVTLVRLCILLKPLIISGLAYQGSGTGGILLIEASILPAGKGRLVLTGSLGDVIKESAELALSFVSDLRDGVSG
jgi:ATP-dependent Lon protease